jgi:hypothetical protein
MRLFIRYKTDCLIERVTMTCFPAIWSERDSREQSKQNRGYAVNFRFFALLCLLSCIFTQTGSALEWSGTTEDIVVSYDDNEYARGVQIINPTSDYGVHLFWCEDAPSVRELHYGYASESGEEWSCETSDRVISFNDGNDIYQECAVANDPYGIVMAVWSEEHNDVREVHYGVMTGDDHFSSETADLILSNPASTAPAGVPSVICDQNFVWHVVWHQEADGYAEIHYGRSADGGLTWSSSTVDRVISFPDGNSALEPKITVCDNHLIVVWRENDESGYPRIHMGRSLDGGDTWSCSSADRAVSQAATLMGDVAVSSDYANCSDVGTHVVYKASYNTSAPYHYEIFATASYDGGATWTGEGGLVSVSCDEGSGNSAHSPDVSVSYWSCVIAVWNETDETSGTTEQHVSYGDYYNWSGAIADSIVSFPDGENGYRPSVAGSYWITKDNYFGLPRYYVAWTEFAGGTTDNYEVHISVGYEGAGHVVDEPESMMPLVRIAPCPAREEMYFKFDLPAPGPVTVDIFNTEGRLVRSLSGQVDGSDKTIPWKGTDTDGRLVQPGLYLARIRTPSTERTISLVRL